METTPKSKPTLKVNESPTPKLQSNIFTTLAQGTVSKNCNIWDTKERNTEKDGKFKVKLGELLYEVQ